MPYLSLLPVENVLIFTQKMCLIESVQMFTNDYSLYRASSLDIQYPLHSANYTGAISKWLMWHFMYLLVVALSVNGCQIDIRQPQELLTGRKNESVLVQCHINISACSSSGRDVLWYGFTSDSHHQLDMKSQPFKYQLDSQGLQIKSLTTSVDGVYYCAVVLHGPASKGAQAFGNGTTVMV